METKQDEQIIQEVKSILENKYEDTRYVLLLETLQGGELRVL